MGNRGASRPQEVRRKCSAPLTSLSGGYALARSAGGKTIKACVHRHGHGLYTGKCAKHDKKLVWNQAGPQGSPGQQGIQGPPGPQGPGARTLTFAATGSGAPSATKLGNAGPWTLSADCARPTATSTSVRLFIQGPSGRIDGTETTSTGTATAVSLPLAAHSSPSLAFAVNSPSTTQAVVGLQLSWQPSSGTPVATTIALAATGGATNSCHLSAVVTPTS